MTGRTAKIAALERLLADLPDDLDECFVVVTERSIRVTRGRSVSVRVTRREVLRRAVLGGLGLAVGALTACDVAAPPPTPRPIPTPVRKAVEPTPPPPSPVPEAGGPVTRILLEAEDFVPAGAAPGTNPGQGWRPIGVGQGNYMVDSIGASHVSGESLLFARAEDVGARAYLDTSVPKAGQYRLLARYEYPVEGAARQDRA